MSCTCTALYLPSIKAQLYIDPLRMQVRATSVTKLEVTAEERVQMLLAENQALRRELSRVQGVAPDEVLVEDAMARMHSSRDYMAASCMGAAQVEVSHGRLGGCKRGPCS